MYTWRYPYTSNSFHSITSKMQHPFTLTVAVPSSCGKSKFVIRLLERREQFCDVVFENVWRHSQNNASHHLKALHLLKAYRPWNPWKCTYAYSAGWLMDSAYCTKVSQLFTKGLHHRNISLDLITQNVFHQGPSSRDISMNSKYKVVFKNPRDKTRIVH